MRHLISNKLQYHPERLAEWMATGGSRPISAQFRITDRCPFSCVYCDKPIQQADSHVDDRFIARLLELGIKSIVLTGGEPTVYENFDADVEKLAQNFKLGIVTTLIKYRRTLETHFEWVKVSLDSVNPDIYASIRGFDAVNTVLNNMRNLRANMHSKCVLGSQIVLTHEHTLADMRQTARAMAGVADYLQVRPIEAQVSEPYLYSEDELARVRALVSEHPALVVASPKFGFVGAPPPATCPARWSQLVVNSAHEAVLCCNRQHEVLCSVYDDRILKLLASDVDMSACYSPCALSEHNAYVGALHTGMHKEFV
jgi:MoaA/NifB/PqqE/SkfB family radical SAM enzyme